MSVRAKFRVTEIRETAGGGQRQFAIEMEPVKDGSAVNAAFYRYTPGGKIELQTVNEAAGAIFKAGSEYFVDFSPADVELTE